MNLQLPHWAIILFTALIAAGKAVESSLPAPWSTVDQAVCYVLVLLSGGLGVISASALKAKGTP